MLRKAKTDFEWRLLKRTNSNLKERRLFLKQENYFLCQIYEKGSLYLSENVWTLEKYVSNFDYKP